MNKTKKTILTLIALIAVLSIRALLINIILGYFIPGFPISVSFALAALLPTRFINEKTI